MRKRRRPSSYQDSSSEEGLVNLTPLIDVVFIVLIIFILIAPMLEIEQIDLASAGSQQEEPLRNKSPITIYVKEDDSIWLGQRKVSPSQLTFYLKESKHKFPNQNPQLFHDKRAHFGTYQTVKNAIEASGYSEMDLILRPN